MSGQFLQGNSDRTLIGVVCLLLTALLVAVIWWNDVLPMQDYPQHLYMVAVIDGYHDPANDWAERLEVRNLLAPYRLLYLVHHGLGQYFGVVAAGKVIVSGYILLVGLLALLLIGGREPGGAPWCVLLLFPLSFHPIYYYGFLNFTLSIPVLLIALLHLESMTSGRNHRLRFLAHLLLLFCLLLLHPYTLLVYIALAAASVVLLVRTRQQLILIASCVFVALCLYLVWQGIEKQSAIKSLSIAAMNFRWWSLDWNLDFLALPFVGMRLDADRESWLAITWITLMLVVLIGAWRGRGFAPFRYYFLVLGCLALAGYFLLPFSVFTPIRYTYFSVRLFPIALFLMVAFLATLHLGRASGRILGGLSVLLTLNSIYLHHSVASEAEASLPLFAGMGPAGDVLPLIGKTPSAELDPFFYSRFYQHFPFYYHVLKGGGVNPDLFNNTLVPVAFVAGKRPGLPPGNEFYRWPEYADQDDYIITRNVSAHLSRQLQEETRRLDVVGPWAVYQLSDK